jgi:U3 small nucleolar RNA-associated protein 25
MQVLERLYTPFLEKQGHLPPHQSKLQSDLLSALATDRDLYMTKLDISDRRPAREVVLLHALDHVMK